MAKQYLDYEGLKLYTQEIKKWVLEQIQSASSITPEEVDSKINAAINNASSTLDDTKVYATYADMIATEPTGREDVIYIDQETGLQYVWNGSSYEVLLESIASEDISNIMND